MTEQENVQLVQELYRAFGRGDVPAILEQLTDDVVWYDPGPPEVPHAGRYVGAEEVGRFFARTGETLQIDEFAPTEFLAQADRVVVLGSLRAQVRDAARLLELCTCARPVHHHWRNRDECHGPGARRGHPHHRSGWNDRHG
jgi:uncharacterized protein